MVAEEAGWWVWSWSGPPPEATPRGGPRLAACWGCLSIGCGRYCPSGLTEEEEEEEEEEGPGPAEVLRS